MDRCGVVARLLRDLVHLELFSFRRHCQTRHTPAIATRARGWEATARYLQDLQRVEPCLRAFFFVHPELLIG